MNSIFHLTRAAVAVTAVAGCAMVPSMPPDYMLPMREIVLHAACELRFALWTIEEAHPSFKPDQWAISISVTPKVDTELSMRAGITGKSSSTTVPFFTSWVVGTAPGAEYDLKGHKDGNVKYLLHSNQLMDAKHFPLDCDISTSGYHALTEKLGIRDWLMRSAAAAEGQMGKLSKIDGPTYNSEIIVTWDGSGSFTYNYPFGTDFAGLLGSYKVDEAVAIALTSDPPPKKPLKVRTLPSGAAYSSIPVPGPSKVSLQAQSNLQFLSLEQTIRNLETANFNRRR